MENRLPEGYMNNDKIVECMRYEARAQSMLAAGISIGKTVPVFGSLAISPIFRAPYIYYEECIRRFVSKDHDVLELGSGMGLHTHALAQTGARVVASDISICSLEVLSKLLRGIVKTQVVDMESLPFGIDSFDVVAVAGSLSYGDPDRVDAEIKRVLRPGGIFICVDSLNHNPIYRFNRWVRQLRGFRTKSTLFCMPKLGRIQSISLGFKSTQVRFFGAFSYLMPLVACIAGQSRAAQLSDAVDRFVNVRRSAFKFVLVASGRL
jgi:SAM-dependent methyltransferase